ncbi:MAG: hypothetical protein KJZ64_03730 [Sphingomonadaceae bacterium]|nr:hypothetical protein [Sphingomonadaceae bacterium]
MTPTASRLKARLDDRRLWFVNEWFFKWHFIGKDGPVEIDSFDGRVIRYGGIQFSGTARDIYWNTIVRGVRKEINEQFAWVDSEIRKYNRATALVAIDECAGQLISFARQIRRKAVQKDCILRGNGVSFPSENDARLWDGTSEAEILAQAAALKAALPLTESVREVGPPLPVRFPERALAYWNRNQWWLGPAGMALAIAGLVSPFLI